MYKCTRLAKRLPQRGKNTAPQVLCFPFSSLLLFSVDIPGNIWSKDGWEGMLDCWVELRCLHHPSSTCATPGGFHKPAASTTPNAWGPFTDPTGAPTPHMIQTGFHANICPTNFSLIPTYGFHGPFKSFLLLVASGILFFFTCAAVCWSCPFLLSPLQGWIPTPTSDLQKVTFKLDRPRRPSPLNTDRELHVCKVAEVLAQFVVVL